MKPHAREQGQQKPAARCSLTLPEWTGNSSLTARRSQPHWVSEFKLSREIGYALGYAFPQIPSSTHCTLQQLSSRREELSRWQSQTSESLSRVDKEITALQQVRDAAESCVQEKISYCKVLRECVQVRDSHTTGDLVQDHVLIELKKEVELATEIRELVQKQLYVLLDKLSSLREIHALLLKDYRDKGEAIKLNTKCMTFDPNSSNMASHNQPSQSATDTLTYDQWLSHCKCLKLTVDKLVKDCSSFRGNLQLTLAKMKNALENQRCATDSALRKRINDMIRTKEVLEWERQQMNDTIMDLMKERQRVEAQLMSCGSKMQLAHSRLHVLQQRPSHELCLDQAHICLMLEVDNLAKFASALRMKLQLSQQTLEPSCRSLLLLEDRLADKARALDVDLKCQSLRQHFLPLRGTSVVITNRPKLRLAPVASAPAPPCSRTQ